MTMKIYYFLSFALLGGLVLGLACAPVDNPADSDNPQVNAPVQMDQGEKLPAVEVKSEPVPDGLKLRIEAAIKNVRSRDLLTTNAFWTVFHAILGLGPGVELVDPKSKERTPALEYICNGGTLRGLVFKPTVLGVDVVSTMDGMGQGHQDQFIAEMAQWGMPANRKMKVQGKEYTFMDFVNHSQMRARVTQHQELSWTIIIVAQYIGLDASWENPFREKLHYEDVVKYELNQPVETAACGGTHRLFGLSWAYHLHQQKGGKAEGVWKGVPEKEVKYRDLARKYQNSDGSFSTSFFRGPGDDRDKDRRINTTGHILEWLALALPDHELRAEWVQNAVNALCLQILELQGSSIDSGSMYHAVHGLYIYYARVYGRSIVPPELLVPLPPGWKQV
jgi:hypothetical protein